MPLVAGARLMNVKDTFILFISWEIASGYFTSVNSGFVPEGTGELCKIISILHRQMTEHLSFEVEI